MAEARHDADDPSGMGVVDPKLSHTIESRVYMAKRAARRHRPRLQDVAEQLVQTDRVIQRTDRLLWRRLRPRPTKKPH